MGKSDKASLRKPTDLVGRDVEVVVGFNDRSLGLSVPPQTRGCLKSVWYKQFESTRGKVTMVPVFVVELNYMAAPMGAVHTHTLRSATFRRCIKIHD
jgi:hypothetical protein